ncbi:unnamed protein product [Prorocentrum cordatum]|uniref:Guanylate cyclase domain-containing protein n=1 Tax=Prorocentrum cordatum TaxID=2364126 RepID=A0ABN9TGK1_9DINO|nr:unnamed protein product [Polarella glacialis]
MGEHRQARQEPALCQDQLVALALPGGVETDPSRDASASSAAPPSLGKVFRGEFWEKSKSADSLGGEDAHECSSTASGRDLEQRINMFRPRHDSRTNTTDTAASGGEAIGARRPSSPAGLAELARSANARGSAASSTGFACAPAVPAELLGAASASGSAASSTGLQRRVTPPTVEIICAAESGGSGSRPPCRMHLPRNSFQARVTSPTGSRSLDMVRDEEDEDGTGTSSLGTTRGLQPGEPPRVSETRYSPNSLLRVARSFTSLHSHDPQGRRPSEVSLMGTVLARIRGSTWMEDVHLTHSRGPTTPAGAILTPAGTVGSRGLLTGSSDANISERARSKQSKHSRSSLQEALESLPSNGSSRPLFSLGSLSTIIAAAVAFSALLASLSMYVVLEVLAQDALDLPSDEGVRPSPRDRASAARLQALIVCLLVTVVGLAIGWYVSRMVTIPVRTVTELMQLLGELNTEESEQLATLYNCSTSRLREVRELQHSFGRMSRCIEMFKRYVPNSVVRDIVRGDERAMRLHVSQREVTIMFSDIANFTPIAESLKQVDLLFLLTRYFSIMTRIVETYEGMVAEILGDGLVVFWNTPDDVSDHAAKACAAALAQQQVLKTLNTELSQFKLPQIKIRIGLHTGVVLSGNIGSESKMKFGCMGDPVNLASRLESLCKVYGVWILCSEATVRLVTRHDRLMNTDGFVMRELDLVQVKGKSQPTRIYEIMGISDEEVFNEEHLVDPERACGDVMQASTIGMKKLEDLRWNPLKQMARRFSMKFGDTSASESKISASPSMSPRPRDRDAMDATSISQSSPRSFISTRKPSLSPRRPSNPPTRHRSPINSSSTVESRSRLVESAGGAVVPEHVREMASRYEDALCAYQQGLFHEARHKALGLNGEWPDDVATRILLEQISKVLGPDGKVCGLTDEERLSWTGVTVLSNK